MKIFGIKLKINKYQGQVYSTISISKIIYL